MPFASGVFLRPLIGELWTPKFSPRGNTQCHSTARLMWTKDGSKGVILHKDAPFGGVNDVPLSWEFQIPKTEVLGR